LKATIKALADRDYPRQFPNALDYVVLFVPAESLFSAALEGDHDLDRLGGGEADFAGDAGVAHRAVAFGERELPCASSPFSFSPSSFPATCWRAKARCSIPAGGSNRANHQCRQPGFNDGDWQAVSIPHNWGWEEAQQGKDFYRGPGWYRRDLNLGAPQSGKRYFLRFEAASLVADVYLNGERLGQHRGAFGAFVLKSPPTCPPPAPTCSPCA
jgi:hypothetical protein